MALRTIPNHFAHPNHPLKQTHDDRSQYICGACNTNGASRRYRCQYSCNFNLHEYCATCPTTITSFTHQHQLHLVSRNPQNERACDLCGDHIGGVFYRCKLCEFDAHPLCTQLPQHALHKAHPSTLQPSPPYGAYAHTYGRPSGFIPYNNYQYPNVNLHHLHPPGSGATYPPSYHPGQSHLFQPDTPAGYAPMPSTDPYMTLATSSGYADGLYDANADGLYDDGLYDADVGLYDDGLYDADAGLYDDGLYDADADGLWDA